MSNSSSHTLQLSVNSGLSSGLAAFFFDILLLSVIKAELQVLCSVANIFLLYDRRCSISPTQSRLGIFTGGPIGPTGLSRAFSALLALTTACVIALGFTINGKTVPKYEEVTFQSVVQITNRPATINFEQEFKLLQSQQRKQESIALVSRRLMAISDSYVCHKTNYTHAILFAYAYKNDSLGYAMFDPKERLAGAECVEAPPFKKPLVSRTHKISIPRKPAECTLRTFNPTFHEKNLAGYAIISQPPECDLNLTELQCFKVSDSHNEASCASMSKGIMDGYDYVLLVPNTNFNNITEIVQVDNIANEEDRRKVALNVAFFSAVGFGGGVSNLANMAITEISHNRTMEYVNGTKDVSEINTRIAFPILIFVGAVTVLLLLSAIFLWIYIVYLKGRRFYNTFSSVSDILQMAYCNSFKYRRCRKISPYIGIARSFPKIVVMGRHEKEYCSGSKWREDELEESVGYGYEAVLDLNSPEEPA